MEWLMDSLHYVASFLLIISIIVFIHEFGHYLAARLCGVRVEEFSLGFGKRLWGWKDSHGTDWKVSLLPIGGYVKMFGDADASSRADYTKPMTAAEKAVSFMHKPLWKKAIVVGAGPASNFILAIIIMTGFFIWIGKPATLPVVDSVQEGSAAAQAGILPGDWIVELGGRSIESFDDISRVVKINPGIALEAVVKRGKTEDMVHLTITPARQEQEDAFGNKVEVGLLGVTSTQVKYSPLGGGEAAVVAVEETWKMSRDTLVALGQMIMGQRDVSDLGGPIKIAKYSGQSTERGWATVLWFIAVLSVNLGLINLFPIPMLDGGHLMFYLVEAVSRRPVAVKVQEYSFRVGFALIIGLMLFTTANDIVQIFVK